MNVSNDRSGLADRAPQPVGSNDIAGIAGFDRIVVVGLGLIGGSLAKALAPLVEVVGVDPDPVTCAAATLDGIATASLEAAITNGSLVVVAVPVQSIDAVFGAISATSTAALITDVGSVKGSVITSARAAGLRFVGGHPMAGSERSGYSASIDSLFSGARWALTIEADTVLDDWMAVAQVAMAAGAGVVPITAADHDDAVAAVSHLPHVLAAALAGAVGSDPQLAALRLGLAAGSFRDGTRVARAPGQFWTSVLTHNAGAVEVMVDAVADQLVDVAAALRAGNTPTIEAFFTRGSDVRIAFDDRTSIATTLSGVNNDELRAGLLQLGAKGGFVTLFESVDGRTVVHARVPMISNPATTGTTTSTGIGTDDSK